MHGHRIIIPKAISVLSLTRKARLLCLLPDAHGAGVMDHSAAPTEMSYSQVGMELSQGRTRCVRMPKSPGICILSPDGFHLQLWAGLPWEVLEPGAVGRFHVSLPLDSHCRQRTAQRCGHSIAESFCPGLLFSPDLRHTHRQCCSRSRRQSQLSMTCRTAFSPQTFLLALCILCILVFAPLTLLI